jgi:hypothetical protein
MSAVEKVSLIPEMQSAGPTLAPAPDSQYNVSIGYLRAFITVLVVAHHAALAYHPYAPPSPANLVAQPRWWQAFPVTDTAHWNGFAALVGFNDIFFMSLMFFSLACSYGTVCNVKGLAPSDATARCASVFRLRWPQP